MRKLVLIWLALGVGLACGCAERSAPVPAVNQNPQGKSLLKPDWAAQRELLDAPYQLKLDARIPLAFRALHQMLTAGVQANFRSELVKQRQILYLDQIKLAELPAYPELGQAKQALQKYVEVLAPSIVRTPQALGSKPASETPWLEPLETSFERLRSVAGLRAAELMGPDVAPRIAKALVNICFQSTDRLGTADEVCARALALLVVAEKVSPVSMTEPAALLAYTLGYEAEAAKLAEALGPEHPLRAFVTRNQATLRRLSTTREPTFAERMLWLIRLNESGKVDEEAAYRAQYFRGDQLTVSVLCARMRAPAAALQRELVEALPSLLLLEATALTREPAALRFRSGIRGSSARLEELVGTQLAIERLLVRGRGVYLGYGNVIERLSARAGAADALSPAATRSFLSTLMYSALRVRASWALAGEDKIELVVAGLRSQKLGDFADFSRWLDLILGPKLLSKAPEQIGRAEKLRDFGGLAWQPLYETFDGGARFGSSAEFALAKAFFSHLDSRPRYRRLAANVASVSLSDLLLRERLLDAAVKAAPNADPELSLTYARFVQDSKQLIAYSKDSSWELAFRASAVAELGHTGSPSSEAIGQHFSSLLSDTEDDWAGRAVYVSFLKRQEALDSALSITRAWLYPNPRSSTAHLISARTEAASILMKQGKTAEGWKLVEPMINTLQSDALRVGSQILVRLKNVDRAVALAGVDLKQEPRAPAARANCVELLWRAGRYEAAAKMLTESASKFGEAGFGIEMSERFAHALGSKPEAARLAFDALREAKPISTVLARLGGALQGSNPGLAFELLQSIKASGPQQFGNLLSSYAAKKQAQGESAALAWISEHVNKKSREGLVELAYTRHVDELLWDFADPTDKPQAERDLVWLFRAAALLRERKNSDPNFAKVKRYFQESETAASPGSLSLSLALGRYLVGTLPLETLLPFAHTPHNACRVAYYLGVKAQASDQLEAAHTWYRMAAETGPPDLAEHRFAVAQLEAWRDTGKALKFLGHAN